MHHYGASAPKLRFPQRNSLKDIDPSVSLAANDASRPNTCLHPSLRELHALTKNTTREVPNDPLQDIS